MSHTRIDLQHQVQGILGPLHGGTANTHGYATEQLLCPFHNDSGGTLALGTVVTRSTSNPKLHATSTAGEKVVGVIVGRYNTTTGLFQASAPDSEETAAVCVAGRVIVLTSALAVRGDYVRASATTGVVDSSSTLAAGSFGYVLFAVDSSNAQILLGQMEGGIASFGTPGLTLSTSNSAGVASTGIRTDATILAFDATVPVTQAFADSAATGSAAVAARRDHKHGIPDIFDSTAPTDIAFGDGASAGGATVAAKRDHRHGMPALFDATAPSTQAFGDSPVVGASAVAAHRDHKHGMPASAVGEILIVDTPSTPLVFADLVQNDDQNDLLYAD